jgi:hypothetical protein
MGFLDRFKKKDGGQVAKEEYPQGESQRSAQAGGSTSGKKIKKYTSDGKPVNE